MIQLVRGTLAALLSAFVVLSSQAQPLLTEDAVTEGVRSANFEVLAAREAATADAQRPDQVTWAFPMLQAQLMPGMIADGQAGVTFMAQQTLPRPGVLRSERDARRHAAEATQHDADALMRQRVLEGRLAYVALWQIQEELALLDSFRIRTRLYEDAALFRYRAGRGSQQAALQVSIEDELRGQRRQALDEQRTSLRQRIALLTGGRIQPSPNQRLSPPSSYDAVPVDSARVEVHPLIAARQSVAAAADASTSVSRALGRPEFSINVAVDVSPMARERMYGREPIMPGIGVMLPLWRGGVRAQVEEAEARMRQRQFESEQARLTLNTEFRDVMRQLAQAGERIRRYDDAIRPRIELTREATLSGYRAGTSALIELLDVERTAFDLELELLSARAREAELYARLRYLIGE